MSSVNAIYLHLREVDALCFTCDQEGRLDSQSSWLCHCNEVAVDYLSKGIKLYESYHQGKQNDPPCKKSMHG
jgi:hypothetical protein